MTTLRQAAQQALEALESGLAFDAHSTVLQNLREALAQPEQKPVGWEHHEYRPYGAPGGYASTLFWRVSTCCLTVRFLGIFSGLLISTGQTKTPLS